MAGYKVDNSKSERYLIACIGSKINGQNGTNGDEIIKKLAKISMTQP
jgi:hypothetical protein